VYICHQILYYVLVYIIFPIPEDEEYLNVYRYLDDFRGSLCY